MNIFQICLSYLEVDELTVFFDIIISLNYVGQECSLNRTPKKRAFSILPGPVIIAITPEEVNIFQISPFN